MASTIRSAVDHHQSFDRGVGEGRSRLRLLGAAVELAVEQDDGETDRQDDSAMVVTATPSSKLPIADSGHGEPRIGNDRGGPHGGEMQSANRQGEAGWRRARGT